MTTVAAPLPQSQSLGQPFKPTRETYRDMIGLLMIFTVSRIHQNFSILNKLHPALLLVALASLYALGNPSLLATEAAIKTRSYKKFMAMAIMACLSVPLGLSIGGSGMFILTEYSKVLVFALLVLVGIRHSRDLYAFLWAFALSGGCLAYLGVFVFQMQASKDDDFTRIQNGYSYDSNDIGLVCVLCLVIAMLVYQTAKGRGKTLCLVTMLGLGMTIGRTGSRGALLTFGMVSGMLLFMLPNVSIGKKMGFVAITILGVIIAAPSGYWEQMSTLFAPTQDYNWSSETGRKEVALRGLGYMMTNPATGIGIGNFPRAEGEISDRALAHAQDQSLAGVKWSNAHNSFIQVIAEMGIPGTIIFMSLVFGSALECYRLRKKMPASWVQGDPEQQFLYLTSIYLPVALLGFAVGGSFVSFAYIDPIYLLVAFVGGLHVSVAVRLKQEQAGVAGALAGSAPLAPPRPRYRGGLPPIGYAPGPPPVTR